MHGATPIIEAAAGQQIEELRAQVARLTQQLEDACRARESLRRAYTNALEQLELMRRRLFVAKAERFDAPGEQLSFEQLLGEVDRLKAELDADSADSAKAQEGGSASAGDSTSDEKKKKRKKSKAKPKGRRNLANSSLPLQSVNILDPELERDDNAKRIGFEVRWELGYERGGFRRIEIRHAVYKIAGSEDEPSVSETPTSTANEAQTEPPSETRTEPPSETRTESPNEAQTEPPSEAQTEPPNEPFASPNAGSMRIVRAPPLKELTKRSLLAPALIAHFLVAKYMMGTPFYRLEQQMALQGAALDRGTMCRVAENVGASLGAIVLAARDEAMAHAFCLSTDATGVRLQPTPLADGRRQPCRKGHFFVVLADRDHIFFEYQPRHTSAAVCEMFKGFTGYIQADAHAVYDALFLGSPQDELFEEPAAPPPKELGCWSHCRRYFWEAAICKHPEGVEGLLLCDAIFAADAMLAALPPSQKKLKRLETVLPRINAFFEWIKETRKVKRERGLVSKALGYAFRQEAPLRRFLEDGRLRMDNNSSERALRFIAVGRNSWLFFGSDDHAEAAANLFSLIASCKLHRLDPEAYLCEVIRVMPYWPRERYLELSPKYWARTRSRLDPAELAQPVGPITVPPPLPAEEESVSC